MFKKSNHEPSKLPGSGDRDLMPLYTGNQNKNSKPIVKIMGNAKGSRIISK